MSAEKVLIVLNILEGRNFSRSPDFSLVVEGCINGEVLSTDPISHSSSTLCIQTELAWEMKLRALQQHKLHRTPVKLQVFTVDNATSTRKLMGYVLLDLRTAKTKNMVQENSQWHKILNCSARGPCPELCLSLSIENQIEEQDKNDTLQTMSGVSFGHTDKEHTLVLEPSGDYYSFHSPLPQRQLFLVSITLQNPYNLPQSLTDEFYYRYHLLDNEIEITSEMFKAPNFKAEKASIRILCTRGRLSELFSSRPSMQVYLCHGDEALGKGSLSLDPLSGLDFFECRVEIELYSGSSSFIDVTVHLQKDAHMSIKSPSSHLLESQVPSLNSLSSSRNDVKNGQLSNESSSVSSGTESVKRNLTRTFEEVTDQVSQQSLDRVSEENSPTEKASTIEANNVPEPQDLNTDYFKSIPESQKALPEDVHISSDIPKTDGPQLCHTLPSTTYPETDVSSPINQKCSNNGKISPPCTNKPSSYPLPHPDSYNSCVDLSKTIHQYQYSIDIHSIQNMQLDERLKCFVKYNYPNFGCRKPIIVQPTSPLVLGTKQKFSESLSTFRFTADKSSLVQQLYMHPLSLELWAIYGERSDCLVGIARIPLGEVFTNEQVKLGTTVYQQCSLKVPVMANMLDHVTCAYIDCTLKLEDYGPTQQYASEVEDNLKIFGNKGLPNSHEYIAAMELEMWKLSQEEIFTDRMKAKEAEYLHKLGKVWQKREEERQKILTEKIQSYNKLERHLRDAVEATEHKQKQLLSREAEVQQLRHKLSLEGQSVIKDFEAKIQQYQLMYEGKIAAEKSKVEEQHELVERLKGQVSALSRRLASRDTEFDAYRQQVLSKPESKLQAELTMIHMEKSELERKLLTALKSKQHYKEQWSKALKELATYRQKEQAKARHLLQRQQQELESMRAKQIHDEEQQVLCTQLKDVKDEISRFEQGISSAQENRCPSLIAKTDKSINPDVARWMEEREILLQTGVYSHQDLTIQKLDQKIKTASK